MKARLPEGYNRGAGNVNTMLKQAQKMQSQMEELEERLNEKEYSAKAGGGMIELVMTGAKELKSVKLNPEIVDKDNIEDLEDMIVAGINAIIGDITREHEAEMEKITGGMSLPGVF